MSENAPENENPAWQTILNELPEDLHPLLKPKLEEWDRTVQQKFEEVRQPYQPYQQLVDNQIDPQFVERALWLANRFQENPEELISEAIQKLDLGFIPKDQAPSGNDDDDDDDDWEDFDLENHPAFKQMKQQVEQANQIIQSQQQSQQEQEQAEDLNNYLKSLHEDKGEFNDMFVVSLMAQGVSGEDAVEQYRTIISEGVQQATGGQQQVTTPPVVLGGDGASGSGVPNQPVKMGDLSKGQAVELAMQFLAQNDTNKTG